MLQLVQGSVPAVYDITIGYVGLDGYLTEKGLLKGQLPREIHIHVERYELKSLPVDAAASGQWLKALWDAKEDRLAKFHATTPHSFASGATPLSSKMSAKWASSSATSAACALLGCACGGQLLPPLCKLTLSLVLPVCSALHVYHHHVLWWTR